MSRNPPILVLSEIFPPRIGGSGQWLHDLYRRLPSGTAHVVAGSIEGDREFDSTSDLSIERASLSSDEWTLMTSKGRRFIFKMVGLCRRRLAGDARRQLHCARVIPEGVAGVFSTLLTRNDLVCYVHGEDIELARTSRESRWLVQTVIGRSARLICNSENSRDMLLRHWRVSADKIVVLTPGVDTTQYCPSADIAADRSMLGWSEEPVLLTVSRLEERKGHDKMIEAMPVLLKRFPTLTYAIVGSGPDDSRLKTLAREIGVDRHVRFHGAVDIDLLPVFYRACDLFVLPNRRVGSSVEGFGIVLLEAQASGRPVIAGASGGTVETLVEGQTGLLVDCRDANNLVEPIAGLLSDTERRINMGAAARELTLQKFSWSALAARITEACSPVAR